MPIRINLLAEEQYLAEMRRRDPVKRAAWVGGFLGAVAVACWGWLLVSGLVDLVVAALIIAGLPGSAAWAIGLLVGINLVFGGTSLIGMALAARNA